MNFDILSQLHSSIQEQELPVYAVLIVRHGALVFEHYYHDSTRQDTHQIASCTKSILSALVGIALDKGLIHNLDQTLPDFIRDEQLFKLDEQKREIILRHLLTMTSGIDSITSGRLHPEEHKSVLETIFAAPLSSPPGSTFRYSDPGVDLLGEVLSQALPTDLLTFATEHLFHPLGIETSEQSGFRWDLDFYGNLYRGGSGIHMTPRDMAKFGYLYLNGGTWEGQPLIPASYVQASSHAQNPGGWPEEDAYGFLWWITALEGHAAFYAAGVGGQYTYIVPDLDLLVVISSEYERRSGAPQKELLSRFVLPSVIDQR
ncbi:MAG: serine hydrolase [Ktedonobacteraceae bacterium]|nr:serine hydrolase [Ktedonobacteraceae bacterium]